VSCAFSCAASQQNDDYIFTKILTFSRSQINLKEKFAKKTNSLRYRIGAIIGENDDIKPIEKTINRE
jgi:hypothetical protein